MYKLFLVVCFIFLPSTINAKCNIPPRYWCDSKQIAEECMVLPQCASWKWEDDAPTPVFVSVFMESLCPDTIKFITTVLYPVWADLALSGIMKVGVMPYGNANQTKQPDGLYKFSCQHGPKECTGNLIEQTKQPDGLYKFSCQHGPKECTGNLIENCLIVESFFNESVYLPILYCMEKADYPVAAAESCITQGGLSWSSVNDCSKSKKGNLLMHESGLNTENLNPPVTFIPWILINGLGGDKIEDEALKNLGGLVCETYRGKKPAACNKYLTPSFMQQPK